MDTVDFLTVFAAAFIVSIASFFWNYLWNVSQKKIFISIYMFASAILIGTALSLLQSRIGVTHFWDGIFFGFFLWLTILVPIFFFLFFYQKLEKKAFVRDLLFWLIGLIVLSGIIAG